MVGTREKPAEHAKSPSQKSAQEEFVYLSQFVFGGHERLLYHVWSWKYRIP